MCIGCVNGVHANYYVLYKYVHCSNFISVFTPAALVILVCFHDQK